jgi:hypothetical protein
VSIKLWSALANMQMTGNHFWLFGDCEGQFLPIQDQHRTKLLEGLDRCDFIHDLTNGLRVEVKKYRRGTDQAHFNFVGSVYGTPLELALARAKEAYPARGEGFEGVTLVVDHRCRMLVNEQANRRMAPAGHVMLKAGAPIRDCANHPQNMRVWVGLILTALGTEKPLKNGLRYRVVRLPHGEEETFSVQQVNDRDEAVGEVLALDGARMSASLRLSHAICYFSCQARTITGGLRLSQTNHKFFTIRHLVVGLGRGPEGHCIEVE